jgi:hypothetical protein
LYVRPESLVNDASCRDREPGTTFSGGVAMSFNLLGAIGGAVGGLFTGGPIGAVLGGIAGGEGSSSSANGAAATDLSAFGSNPLLPMIPPSPDTISTLLGQGPQPVEDVSGILGGSQAADDL